METTKKCLNCNKKIIKNKKQSFLLWEKQKCCSVKCGALKRKNRTIEHRKNQSGIKNPFWKGQSVGYVANHVWVSRWKGKPKKCEMCGTEKAKKYEWCNIDHKYNRVLEDYIRMCTSCHRKYDYDNKLSNKGSKYGSIKNKI